MRLTQLAVATATAAVTVVVAGCGTTVPVAQQSLSTGGDGLSAGVDGGSAPLSPGTGGPVVGGSTGTSSPGGAGTTGGAGRPGLPPAVPGVPTSVPSVVSVKPGAFVKVGFYVSEDVGKALAAFGLNGLSSGDGDTQAKTATALLNSSGGLDGHPVQAVVYKASATTDSSQQQREQQAACARFFTDNKVVAVVSVLPTPIISECSRKAGVPLSVSSISTLSRADMARFPNVAMPNQIERDHGIDVIVPALKRSGYFAPRSATEVVKVGLVTNEAVGFEKVPAETKSALARIGIELTGVVTMSTADRAAAEASAGVLRFQSSGVTHVVVVDDHGGAMTFFLLAAGSQGYYPRLGLSSYSIPQIAADVLPEAHFEDAVGIGWLPTFDVGLADANKTLTAPARRCMAAMTKAGEDMSSSGSRGIALGVCDSVFALQQAVRGRGLALAGYLAGLQALGRSYVSTLTFSTDFTSRRDGADQVRLLSYDAGCRCFHYTSAPFRA